MQFHRPSLIDILLQEGLVTEDQIQVAQEEQKKQGGFLGETLTHLKFIHPLDLQQALSKMTGIPVVDLNQQGTCHSATDLLPKETWLQLKIVPFQVKKRHLHLACTDPENVEILDHLNEQLLQQNGLSFTHSLYHADPTQIDVYIHKIYGDHTNHNDLNLNENALDLVENILNQAIKFEASDVHFQPEIQSLRVRFRQDGLLRTHQTIHQSLWNHMVVCIKIMANIDIGETRRPQGGSFQRLFNGHHVDFRVATHPTIYGESIVIRILDKDKSPLELTQLGFDKNHIDVFKKLIQQPQGMVIFSGPTGSGKTTTLYALFAEMDREKRNIVTLEQPVEYHLPGIRQTEIKEGIISFHDGLRSILRQDPDVIFIGEIRDEETAHMALRSAMTGHLVFATLHTNDAVSVPARLIDLGLSPTLLSGNILAAVAQRLLRTIHTSCEGKGCNGCFQTGYQGRISIAEIITFDDAMHSIVADGGHISKMNQYVQTKGISTLQDDAQQKRKKGLTTQEEIERVLGTTD